MSDAERISQLLQGLDHALASLASDPGVAPSVRRVARFVSGMPGVTPEARELAMAVIAAEDATLAGVAAEFRAVLASGAEAAAAVPTKHQILLVERDGGTASGLRRELESLGCKVHWATGAGAVPGVLSTVTVDLIVVDVLLPDRDGRDLILELSQDPATAEIPVIAISPPTGRLSLARSECFALGADAFLERSEASSLIGAEIERILGSAEPVNRSEERAGVLRRARFNDKFLSRPMEEANGGVVGLLSLEAFRPLADREGPDAADAALAVVARQMRLEAPQIAAVGRWSTSQLALLIPSLTETAASELMHRVIQQLLEGEWPDPATTALARQITGSLVPAPHGADLDDRMQMAGRIRLGLAVEGTRLVPKNSPTTAPRDILVVEDDPVASALVVHKLRHIGFQVHAFSDGDDASAAIPNLDFDLAILDVNLPGRDGFQLVREIRAGDGNRRRPIIILSGMGSDDDIVRGLEIGADDYMLKPFSPLELTARVRRLLEATRPV